MSDGESAMEEVVGASAPIAEAAAREAWPYRKVLLAVLPPTLALLSVVVGVWDNGRRDRADARRAEDQRQQEVEDNQAAAAAAQSLRRSELVLPKYEKLLVDIHAVTDPINHCIDVLNAYLTELYPDGRLAIFGDPPDEAALDLEDIPTTDLNLRRLVVDPKVVDSCSQISEEIDQLGLSLDQARLVSIDDLEDRAVALADALVVGSDGADALLKYVKREDVTGEWVIYVDFAYTATDDGTRLERVAAELNSSIFAIPSLSDDLIREARGRILDLDE